MSPEALECYAALAAAAARLCAAHRALEATSTSMTWGEEDGEERRRVCAELRAAEEEYLCLRVMLVDL